MFKYFLQGLLFGLAYVAPIGAQNLYVINTAIGKSRGEAFRAALITVFFDISLAISCFFGIGLLIERFSVLKGMILLIGSIAVAYIGAKLLQSSSKVSAVENVDNSIVKVIISCFAVTWLNPQAIIDGSLLLGGFRASLSADMSKYFITGVCTASFLWFNTLAAFVSRLRSRMNGLIKWINIACGAILILYGIKLGYSFIQLIK